MAPIFKPHQLPPSPCVRTAWARAVIVPPSIAISTCLFGLTLIATISRELIMTLWVSRLSFLPFSSLYLFIYFLTTSSVSSFSGLLAFYLFGVLALCFLLDFRLFIWRRVLFWSVSLVVCISFILFAFVMGSNRSSSLRIDANPPADAGSG